MKKNAYVEGPVAMTKVIACDFASWRHGSCSLRLDRESLIFA